MVRTLVLGRCTFRGEEEEERKIVQNVQEVARIRLLRSKLAKAPDKTNKERIRNLVRHYTATMVAEKQAVEAERQQLIDNVHALFPSEPAFANELIAMLQAPPS